jgi:hypothetical protein
MSGAVIYHTGFLAIDRRGDDDLDQRATLLMNRAKREAVLTQRRLGSGRYEYVAEIKP